MALLNLDGLTTFTTNMKTWVKTLRNKEFVTCTTSADTAEKTVDVANYTLSTGSTIKIKFNNANIANNPTLNVGNTGAKSIYYQGKSINKDYLDAGVVYQFVYNGSQWEIIGGIGSSDAVEITQAEYDKLSEEEKQLDRFYVITDASSLGDASDVAYKNTESKLKSTNVQGAVDELNSKLSHVGMIIHSTTLDTEDKVKAIYGGTSWSKIEGKFLLGQSSTYVINSTGGEATHILTVNEMPKHSHRQSIDSSYNAAGLGASGHYAQNNNNSNRSVSGMTSGETGGNAAHNNMPPYKAVYIWERTA